MAKFSPIHEVIENAINLDLANPGFLISEKEQGLKDSAIYMGCLDYYRCWPMKVRMARKYGMDGGQYTIPFDAVFNEGVPRIPKEQQKYAYFLGVMRVNKPSWNQMSNPNNFDRQLLGVSIQPNQYDPLKQITYETYEDLSTGQPQFDIDRTTSTINVMCPFGLGQLIWDFAVGFTNPEYVEMSKVDWLCTFISYRFIESIVQARSGIKLTNAGFDVSTAALEERLAYLREKVGKIKALSISYLCQWS
jgi:hypothetical protein